MVQQTVIEGTGISAETLRSIDEIKTRCEEICRTFQLSVLDSVFYDFDPGLSVVLVLSESHMAIHTWPDKGYLNLDIITCTKRGVDPVRLADLFAEIFEPSSLRCHRITF
ncbi:S-adenosylmethionine decarboxylase [Tessaracoccus sp. MC1679]|uniref:S-adenosylmethionine decarboxylase family protein n=1 Tax=Tessaracoccus sp. MC1679 TaxID=2760313 RepID=UPI0016003D78|nr:S-adenosylmethionine decarboxylase [Tessaracoccus sp. MC1679]